jgi:hypothetical protein
MASIIVLGQYISGYAEEINGETIRYECQQPDADSSLLVRSLNEEKFIEWITAPVPEVFDQSYAEFILITGIDVNAQNNHKFKMYIDDEYQYSFRNPVDTLTKNWEMIGSKGIRLSFTGVMIDKYGDLFGYMFLKVPKSYFADRKQLKIKVTGETADSRSWFMVFKYNAFQGVKFIEEQAITNVNGKDYQLVRVDILHFDKPAQASINIGNIKQSYPVKLGFNLFRINVPEVTEPVTLNAEVRINDKVISEQNIMLHPVKRKTIYLLPHSHNDIGYTHVQTEVEKIQWQNLDNAIRYAQETKDYPNGSQFKWNVEVMWAVESYMKQASEKEKQEFIDAVQKGWLELDGLYANILSGLCRPEELYQMLDDAYVTANLCNTQLTSAMITDIPGYSWGIIPVMAHCGIKYFSIGTNSFHRIGDILQAWGDKPFYWESPSGKEKILCWVHGKGYSEFHTGLAYTQLKNKLKEQLIFDYINELNKANYPYDIITMRYNIGSDNGPPDPYLSDIVKEWNEKYTSPRLIISTVSESFETFEKEYGKSLPIVRGDFNGYWEDGACSSALETAINRESSERLIQTGTLLTILDASNYPYMELKEAWKNVLLFSEHTWGSWNSISEPFDDFTLQQWEIKQSFALQANEQSISILKSAFPVSSASSAIDIYNSNSWERTDLVLLPKNITNTIQTITDETGNIILSQKLSTGEIAFVANEVPAFGAKRYFINNSNENQSTYQKKQTEFIIHNDNVEVTIDPESGAISKLKITHLPYDLVNPEKYKGINDYYYIEGRLPDKPETNDLPSIVIKENGPLVVSFIIESAAPGCNHLQREVRIINGINRVDIINTIDKSEILEPEGVHFAFPFNIPDGQIRISTQWNYYNPMKELLPGSNKNFFSVNRWADVSNDQFGVTWVSIDAPLIELEQITMDEIEYGWVHEVPRTQTILSYVMNNYWETNYKASQEGKVVFRYTVFPHSEFDPIQSEKWGVECHQSLIAVPASKSDPVYQPQFVIDNKNVIVSSVKKLQTGGVLLNLYNPGNKDEIFNLKWPEKYSRLYLSDPFGKIKEPLENEIEIPARDIKNLVVK